MRMYIRGHFIISGFYFIGLVHGYVQFLKAESSGL